MGQRGAPYPDEEPFHFVTISQEFLLGRTPVTQAQWREVMKEVGKDDYRALLSAWHPALARFEPPENLSAPSHFKGDERPVEQVGWADALAFCAKAERLGLAPEGWRVTLPTEAQWEYACRAGTQTDYHTGDGEGALAEAGWYGEEWEQGGTHLVAQKKANPWGLYDLHGNVREWCLDAWDEDAYARCGDDAVDPFIAGPADAIRVLRGGAWDDDPADCRASCRDGGWPDGRGRFGGFRVCLVRGSAFRQPVTGEGRGEGRAEGGAAARTATRPGAQGQRGGSERRSNA